MKSNLEKMSLQVQGCSALIRMAASTDDQIEDAIETSGCIDAIITAMAKYKAKFPVHERTCVACFANNLLGVR
jgi:hypothetical protein